MLILTRNSVGWKCCIPYCDAVPENGVCEIPAEPGRNNSGWFQRINQKEKFTATHPLYLKESADAIICPLHFEKSNLESDIILVGNGGLRLADDLMPTIFPWSLQWLLLPGVKVTPIYHCHTQHFEIKVFLKLLFQQIDPAFENKLQRKVLKYAKKGDVWHFCCICEYSTKKLLNWEGHMRSHESASVPTAAASSSGIENNKRKLSDPVDENPSRKPKLTIEAAPAVDKP